MAILKNTYSNVNLGVNPYCLVVELSTKSNEFWVGDWPPTRSTPQEITKIDQDTVWFRVQSDYSLTILTATPDLTNRTAFNPTHSTDASQIRIKGGEIFVIEYQDSQRNETERIALTGYQFGALDNVLIHVDRVNNKITVYQ